MKRSGQVRIPRIVRMCGLYARNPASSSLPVVAATDDPGDDGIQAFWPWDGCIDLLRAQQYAQGRETKKLTWALAQRSLLYILRSFACSS